MSQPLSRRLFLAFAGGALVAPAVSWAADEDDVPALLDHIILGCSDLDRGIDLLEQNTGVRPAFGGVHPGRGTRNALLSLGERRYLEIMAPDPKQQDIVRFPQIRQMTNPRLIGWAVHPGDIAAAAKRSAKIKSLSRDRMTARANAPTAASSTGKLSTWRTTATACSHFSSNGARTRFIPPPMLPQVAAWSISR